MTVSKLLCPLCGKSNACGMANGATTCWCFDVTIAPETLGKIPEEARSLVCICKACASAEGAADLDAGASAELALPPRATKS